MLTSPFFRRLFVPYLLLIVGLTAALGVFAARSLRASYLTRQEAALRQGVRLVSVALAEPLKAGAAPAEIDRIVHQLAGAIHLRLTVMRDDGVVVGDSEAAAAAMEHHDARPEFARAAASGEGVDSRPSATVHTELLYLAQPIRDLSGQVARTPDNRVHYARLAIHLDDLARDLNYLYAGLATFAGVAVGLAGVVGYVFVRRQTAPMLDLTDFARALARGDMARRTTRPEKGEIGTLATSLNAMADSLQGLVEQTTRDKAELLTILSSMSEGVIATDADQRVLLTNDAAGKLLGFDPKCAAGKQLFEVARNDQVIKAAGEVLTSAQRKLISVGPVSARHLDVTLSTFPADGKAKGLVIVAHDITQSFQYQELRKEFVANVSHELRTPLSVIKGFVETLQDGAWKDQRKCPEYLGTIARHTEQLTNLVSDILELSKLESTGMSSRRAPVDVGLAVHRAYELLIPAAERKRHTMTSDEAADLPPVKGNADYIERAVSNLIENAIKYTPDGGRVHVKTYQSGSHVVIEVTDNGLGIPAEDVPRIFERFYRVDRSRSREMGGTGLGLSIVKHVVQVHGGSVDVESTPGKGSTFRLKFPVG